MYAKIENNQVIQLGLPQTGILKNGESVSAYNLLPYDILKSEGWLPYAENQPNYNKTTQCLEFDYYDIQTDKVVINYKVVDIVGDLI